MSADAKNKRKGSFWDFLPWRQPSLADLSPEERRRAKMYLLGAAPGVRPAPGEKMLKIHFEDSEGKERQP